MVSGWVMTTSSAGTTTLTQKNGTQFQFVPGIPPTGSVLVAIVDPNGNTTTIVRPQGTPYQISEIDDSVGRKLLFQYSGYTISQITDPIGRTVSYTYNSAGYLATFTNVLGGVTSYTYNSQGNVTQIKDPHGATTTNTYDSNGRVVSQVMPSGGTMKFAYTLVNALVPTSPVTQTVVTDPLGNVTTYRFNTQGFVVSVTDATGQIRTFNRQLGTNQILTLTGAGTCSVCGDTQTGNLTFTYDANGNLLSQTDALGETWNWTYDPIFSNITSVTDPVGNTTSRAYDAHGNMTKVTDARGNSSIFTYSGTGLMTSATDAAGNTTTSTFDSLGNLVGATNPGGQTWQLSYDGASRLVAQKDPLGRITAISYNAANEVTSPGGRQRAYLMVAFDVAGLLTSLTDANGSVTSYTYDSAGRSIDQNRPAQARRQLSIRHQRRPYRLHEPARAESYFHFRRTEPGWRGNLRRLHGSAYIRFERARGTGSGFAVRYLLDDVRQCRTPADTGRAERVNRLHTRCRREGCHKAGAGPTRSQLFLRRQRKSDRSLTWFYHGEPNV